MRMVTIKHELEVNAFLEIIQGIITDHPEWDLSVTSWIRTPERNEKVGGIRNSKHLYGLAMDFAFDSNEFKDAFILSCRAHGLTVVEEVGHIHVQW